MKPLTPKLTALVVTFLAVAASAQQDLEPAVQTSPAASPASAKPAATSTTVAPGAVPGPAAAPAPAAVPGAAAAAAAPPKGGKSSDRLQLDSTQISGNRELPKVMYVVPWRRPDPGEFSGRPPNSLLDEALTPVDRDVFRRQNRYYSALSGEPGSPNSQPGAATTGAAAPTP
jgi:hypothetical protein